MENVENFPFPTPPDPAQIRAAERKLLLLGALEAPLAKTSSLREAERYMRRAKITKLGKAISAFPLAPRFGKMLALSGQHGTVLLQYTIAVVASLSMQEVLVETGLGQETDAVAPEVRTGIHQIRRRWAGTGQSLLLGDPMVLLGAVGATEYSGGCTQEFCERNGLRFKAMMEIRKLRAQLTNEVNMVLPKLNLALDPQMPPPTQEDAKLLRQIILSGSPDQIARKIGEDELKEAKDKSKFKLAYKCGELEQPVFMRR